MSDPKHSAEVLADALDQVDCKVRPPSEWVRYNQLTATYDTPDGTSVAAELVDGAQCLADVLRTAQIRAKQRANRAA